MQISQILQGKVKSKITKESINSLLSRTSNNNIIHIDKHEYNYSPFVVEEKRSIRLRCTKTKRLNLRTELRVPSIRNLLQTIKGFIKLTHMPQTSLIPRRLSHMNLFF
jgi:hypothetical protein